MLNRFQTRSPQTPVMMLTGSGEADLARQAIAGGAVDYVVKAGAYLETMPLTVSKNLAAGAVERRRQGEAAANAEALRRSENARREAERQASVDPMTGCYNRRAFERVLEQLFADAYRGEGDLSCVMIDLDKFKQVNDTFGHATGDALVKLAARCIRGNLRQMDVACRYGGDEFILLLPRTDEAEAAGVADRIRADYAQGSAELIRGDARTMSIGVASVLASEPRPVSGTDLMEAGDQALYRAKEAGRDATVTSRVAA